MASLVIARSRKREIRLTRWKRIRHRFSPDFWTFFAAAFFFDLGFGLFLFLFNLYLTDLHFNERVVGNIAASLTLGNVVATLPATFLARRLGIRPLLLFSFIAAPSLCIARVLILSGTAQIALAFATGMAMCCWPICFSPAVASLTDDRNRTSGFSIMFATGIGMGTFAGLLGGYIPELLHKAGSHQSIVSGIRVVLLLACGLILTGVWPLLKLKLRDRLPAPGQRLRLHPFLLRFLPPFVLWNVVTGSFPAFGAIYLQQVLKIPLVQVGMIFSASQLAQFVAVLGAPLMFSRRGLVKGIVIAQIGTALFLALIGATTMPRAAVGFYLAYNAMLFMCSPGIYNLLMNRIPESERSTASAVQNLSGALCQAGTQALTGICIVQFGYRSVLLSNAAFAIGAALLFLGIRERASTAEAQHAGAV
ncbi:MFS transporter [Occallatibacter riparius]|uniref:MFS transporter n=1 Tax=Occallatibacter riparius TaxID=1002689 RepID=A0A9J7BMY1_9BACT|nr:MFS transporter [Occallatibacter riparius]UWZ82270.1 MFS transporter [Occallatibacter riparius]